METVRSNLFSASDAHPHSFHIWRTFLHVEHIFHTPKLHYFESTTISDRINCYLSIYISAIPTHKKAVLNDNSDLSWHIYALDALEFASTSQVHFVEKKKYFRLFTANGSLCKKYQEEYIVHHSH